MTAAAWAVPFAALAGCAYAFRHHIRGVILRARWAWRCRGKPVPGDGEKLTREEIQVLGNLDDGRDVRSRT